MERRREGKVQDYPEKEYYKANYITNLNSGVMITYSYIYIYQKNCKKDSAKEVGVDVHNLIIDVL